MNNNHHLDQSHERTNQTNDSSFSLRLFPLLSHCVPHLFIVFLFFTDDDTQEFSSHLGITITDRVSSFLFLRLLPHLS